MNQAVVDLRMSTDKRHWHPPILNGQWRFSPCMRDIFGCTAHSSVVAWDQPDVAMVWAAGYCTA